MAVASSSSHRWVDGWLNKLDIMPYFKTVVCRDDNLPVKPDPALFLRAAENLEIQPSQCLVLEDSQNGTTAAFRAGMPVISIPNRVTVQADFFPCKRQNRFPEGTPLTAGRGTAHLDVWECGRGRSPPTPNGTSLHLFRRKHMKIIGQ